MSSALSLLVRTKLGFVPLATGALAFVTLHLFGAPPAHAEPAKIKLEATGPARVIRGAEVEIVAQVWNVAGPTAGDPLEYDITFTHPDGMETDPVVGVLQPDEGSGLGYKTHLTSFNTAPNAFGTVETLVRVTDPDASNSPQEATVPTLVLKRAVPLIYITVKGKQGKYVQLTDVPNLEGLQAAAGGDGPIALATGVVLGDPPVPTANLDLDTLSEIGSPEMRATFHTFNDLPAAPDDDPAYGLPFEIYLDTTARGLYSKTWYFGFSDEDIPGARPYGSVESSFTFYVELVSEPNSCLLAVLGLLLTIGLRRKERK